MKVRAILVALACWELLTSRQGWWGLTWLPRQMRRLFLLVLPGIFLLDVWRQPRRSIKALLLGSIPALWVQLTLSLWRNWRLDPQARLEPGVFPDRIVMGTQLPLDEGTMPALHVRPRAAARGAVLVIHGSDCHKTFYTWRIVDALLAQRFAVLLIDLDGHGESARALRCPGVEQNVAAGVAWLRARYPLVAVVGYSLGGCIAARAVSDGVAVDALALMAAPARLELTWSAIGYEALCLLQPSFWHIFADSNLYHLLRAWRWQGMRSELERRELIDRLDLLHSLPSIGSPLLLLYGEYDAVIPKAEAEALARSAPQQALFLLFPEVSHMRLTLNPKALRSLAAWLRDISDTRGTRVGAYPDKEGYFFRHREL